jgi:hypothetical protein
MSMALMATVLGAISGSAGAATATQPSSAEVPGAPFVASPSATSLTFAGYQWTVKSSTTPIGPGPNLFDAKGPFVDSSGALHLQILKTKAGWECSEVILNPTLGYGTYSWTVDGPVSTLDPNVVLALFTYDDSNSVPWNREIDFEASRFANRRESTNAQYVVQPYNISGNLHRITLGNKSVTTVTMTWVPGTVTFSADSLPLWTNSSSSVPTSATEQVHMSLWLFKGVPPSNSQPVSVEVTNFQFTPSPIPDVVSISPTSGPTSGGTTVTVTGREFTGATQVLFGTVPATSFSVVSATQITAVSPARTGSHNIYVTTPSGTSAEVPGDLFTYSSSASASALARQDLAGR